MPHQCLRCGKVFEDGSPELLRGCPSCGGNRFFFIKEPLSDKEREIISSEVEQDIHSRIVEMFGGEEKLAAIKPSDVKKAFTQLAEQQEVAEEKKPRFGIDEETRKQILQKLTVDDNEEPETIIIKKPGEYELDLKGLLDEEPIIIQKNGSYTIHLPSVFELTKKEQKKK
ncbi:MAG TPA: hypothetical protein ENI45_04980 [Thermoplasmatales archaeon]|nr:hypothetical protein [Thermoplasmatales archaeon]